MEKVLTWDKSITPQETGWWCGPASAQIVLNAKGIRVPEADLAREIQTTTAGTDHIGWITDRSLRHRAPQAAYTPVWLPNDPPTQSQRDVLWGHLTRSIDAGWGLVVNWVSPVNNRPQPVKGSQRLQYPAGGTVLHYVTYMGYDTAGSRAVYVGDPGYRPFEGWVSWNQACTLIPPKAYAWASSSPPVTPPAATPVDILIQSMTPTTVSSDRFTELLPFVSECLVRAQCTTVKRAAMLLAQVGHESGGLRWFRELWGPTAQQLTYQGRMGNNNPGDGERYMGRGPLQITGFDNYSALSRWSHAQGYVPTASYFVDNPTELETPKYGFLGVVWYFLVARPTINQMADAGDIRGVSIAINGGTHGLDDRIARYNRCLAIGDQLLELIKEAPAPPPGEDKEGFLMALTDDQQHDIYNWLQVLAEDRFSSISPFRRLGSEQQGAVTLQRRLDFVDGNTHVVMTLMLALAGDPGHLALLREVAGARGDPRYPDRQEDAEMAAEMLDYVAEHGRPEREPPPKPVLTCFVNNATMCANNGSDEICGLTGAACVAANLTSAP